MNFDVLIVGAGSAGCVLAARLSENPKLRVALLEAGGPASDTDIAIPQMWPLLQGRDFDWAYRTTPQAGTAGRIHEWPRGKIIGGSSCLHAMAHVRGAREDFDAWEQVTRSKRWSYEGLLPAFRRMESFSGGASTQHGDDGPLTVMLPSSELSPVVQAYMAAGVAAGVPWLGDHNTGSLIGVAPNSLTIRATNARAEIGGVRHASDRRHRVDRRRSDHRIGGDHHLEHGRSSQPVAADAVRNRAGRKPWRRRRRVHCRSPVGRRKPARSSAHRGKCLPREEADRAIAVAAF